MGARRRKLAHTERRRVTRERRRKVAELLAAGHSVAAAAAELHCGEEVVRRHARALREAARRRAVAEWGSETRAATADLIEAVDDALQKTRAAQLVVEQTSPDYRKLLWLEVYTLRQLADLRRELAAAFAADERTAAEGDEFDEFGENVEDWDKLSNEEIMERATELGIDVSGFAEALRKLKAEEMGAEPPSAGAGADDRRQGTADANDRLPAHVFEPACGDAASGAARDAAAPARPAEGVAAPSGPAGTDGSGHERRGAAPTEPKPDPMRVALRELAARWRGEEKKDEAEDAPRGKASSISHPPEPVRGQAEAQRELTRPVGIPLPRSYTRGPPHRRVFF